MAKGKVWVIHTTKTDGNYLVKKKVQRCRSLPSGATVVPEWYASLKTTRYELLLRPCTFTCGWRRSESGWKTNYDSEGVGHSFQTIVAMR